LSGFAKSATQRQIWPNKERSAVSRTADVVITTEDSMTVSLTWMNKIRKEGWYERDSKGPKL